MPSAKEVRARQNRQKERIAAAHAQRRRTQRIRRRVGATVIIILLVVAISAGIIAGIGNSDSTTVVSPPSSAATTTPTTVALKSVKGKPCVGLKDPRPKGSPAFLIGPGPAPTKLGIQDLKVGTGAVVPKNSKVTINYVGVACSTGKIFDSSYTAGKPYDADISAAGGIIAGWQQGVPGMRIGGVRVLTIPSALAYGTTGNPPIAPDEALFFLVTAVKLG